MFSHEEICRTLSVSDWSDTSPEYCENTSIFDCAVPANGSKVVETRSRRYENSSFQFYSKVLESLEKR